MSNSLEDRVADLLGKLTVQEKILLLSGKDNSNTHPIERLGIPSITMTDGPHGVRASSSETGRRVGPTTCFPTGVSMAAAWNPDLIERVGRALGEEVHGMGCDILLGPCVNIVRSPLGGRNFESYSEDPYLAGRTAVAYVKGVQSQQAGVSVKHFACNNYETERYRASSNVDERTLREIYLPAFEVAVKEAQPWTVMCSYNRVNGVYASQNHHLLTEILKHEWGFEGFVVSDWGANHEVYESLKGGLDLEMPGPTHYFGRLLSQALYNWQIDISVIDKSVSRILRIILKSGRMNNVSTPKGVVNTAEHQTLARKLAEEAITLLKNEGDLLPLVGNRLKSMAIIGPNAAEAVIEGGGSSHVDPPYRVTPLEALKAKMGGKFDLEYEPGCDNFDEIPVVPASWLVLPDGTGSGMQVEFFNTSDLSGQPERLLVDPRPSFWKYMSSSQQPELQFSARWTGSLIVPEDERYIFKLVNTGNCRVFLNDELFFDGCFPADGNAESQEMVMETQKELQGGKPYSLRIEFVKNTGQEILTYRLQAALCRSKSDTRLKRAVELARKCEVALVFAGMPEGYESEGADRPDMDLPGGQDALIHAVAQVNPKTVVVLNTGSPVSMPWLDEVAAIVLAYYPGQENGNAVANVLLGKVNPSGKLPVTFPKRLQNNPAFLGTPYQGARQIHYGEGIFVGYRFYDEQDIEPMFPFGYGLSYTSFEYSSMTAPIIVIAGETVRIIATVKNTGRVAGKEIVQLYLFDKISSLPRPPKELKAFAKVSLQPGEEKTVTFELDERAMAFYDPHQKRWVAEPGEFEVLLGSSSRDIRARAIFTLK
jgi:beta-glucosidase